MSITIKDVALYVGVSVSTVSKAMNDSPEIPEQTKQKVLKAVKELKYVPNDSARKLKSRVTKRIAFVAHLEEEGAFTNPHLFEIISASARYMDKKGYCCCLINQYGDNVDKIRHLILQRSFDGFLVHASSFSKAMYKLFGGSNVPYVIIGKPLIDEEKLSWVDNNNEICGAMAAKHLMDIGRKNIAFIGGEKYDDISESRYKGVCGYLKSVNMELAHSFHLRGQSTFEDGAYMASKLLKRQMADGIICANNTIALGVLNYLKTRVSIPKDVAIVSFDKHPFSQITSPRMTVVDIDMNELGKQATEKLLFKISHHEKENSPHIIKPYLLVRESTVTGKK